MTHLIRSRLIVFFFPLLLAAPFLNRAFFVDDNYFVEIATWLKDHPTLPYHFRTDDAGLQNRGWEENGFVRMVNPLMHQYYLAGLMKVGGNRVWFLRLGCVLLSCFSALFLFELARRWTYSPLLATLLILATPVHWLTSYSLLIDGTAGFFFFGALYFFIRSTEHDSLGWSISSGLFMGLAILTKYPAGLIIPLTLAWAVLRWKKLGRKWIAFIPGTIGILFLVLYSLWTAHLYGRPHILAASGRMVQVFGWSKYLVFLVFLSGSTLLPFVGWRFVNRMTGLIAALIILLGTVFLASPMGGFTRLQGFSISFLAVTSLLFMCEFFRFRTEWIFPKDHFLFIWAMGFVAMMFVVMGWVAVRYYEIVVPAVVLMAIRMMEMRNLERTERILPILFAAIFIFSGALAYADYQQAEPSRSLPAKLENAGYTGGDRHFYLGDSFTMSYLKASGWTPCFPQTELKPGDLVLSKDVTMPQVWFYRRPMILRQLTEFDFPTKFPVKVMDNKGSAGFYASVWGALPYSLTPGSWEKFHLFEVVEVRR